MQVDAGQQRPDRDGAVTDDMAEVAGEDDRGALAEAGEVDGQGYEQRDGHRLEELLQPLA